MYSVYFLTRMIYRSFKVLLSMNVIIIYSPFLMVHKVLTSLRFNRSKTFLLTPKFSNSLHGFYCIENSPSASLDYQSKGETSEKPPNPTPTLFLLFLRTSHLSFLFISLPLSLSYVRFILL